MPIGAHTLLSFLAEPLKQLSECTDTLENYNASENLNEFQAWVCLSSLSASLPVLNFDILIPSFLK